MHCLIYKIDASHSVTAVYGIKIITFTSYKCWKKILVKQHDTVYIEHPPKLSKEHFQFGLDSSQLKNAKF